MSGFNLSPFCHHAVTILSSPFDLHLISSDQWILFHFYHFYQRTLMKQGLDVSGSDEAPIEELHVIPQAKRLRKKK